MATIRPYGRRRRPVAPIVAVALVVLALGLATANFAFALGETSDSVGYEILGNLFPLGFPVVGAIIAWKRPENPIGWVFLGGTIITIAGVLLGSVVSSDLASASALIDYTAAVLFLSGIGLMSVLFLIFFPDGKLPSPRWRIVPAIGVLGVVLNGAWVLVRECSIVSPGDTDLGDIGCTGDLPAGVIRLSNPFGWSYPGGRDLWDAIGAIASSMVLVGLFLGAASLVVRFRRGTPTERAQLKWPMAIIGLAMPLFGAIVLADTFFGVDTQAVSFVVFALLFTGLPVGIGVAILRYRLFDVDRLINRVVVYSLVAIASAAIYAALAVLPLSFVLGAGGDAPSWVVAAATLAVAASFAPIRRRTQAFVDHRFYRARYNATRVIDGFSAQVRNTTDANQVRDLWIESTSTVLKPGSISVWLAD